MKGLERNPGRKKKKKTTQNYKKAILPNLWKKSF